MKTCCLENNYQVEQIETRIKSKWSGAQTIYKVKWNKIIIQSKKLVKLYFYLKHFSYTKKNSD